MAGDVTCMRNGSRQRFVVIACLLAWVGLAATASNDDASAFVKGMCITLQGSENHRAEIEQASASGANAISILIDYGLDDQGRPTVHKLYGLDTRFRLPSESWRSVLEEMITIAHECGLRVELKNAETGNGSKFRFEGEPEEYIEGYLNTTRQLADIAEAHGVERFCVWAEADHIVEQGTHGTVDPENFEAAVLTDWSGRILAAVRERFDGSVGIGFGGTPPSFEYLTDPRIDIRGFDYVEVTFYGDVYPDYAIHTPRNALETIDFYRRFARRFDIRTLIIGEMALEEEIGALPSESRRSIYRQFFTATCGEVDGYYLMLLPPNPDPDLQEVAAEWYTDNPCARGTP